MSLIPLGGFLKAVHNGTFQSKIPEIQRSLRGMLRFESKGEGLMKALNYTCALYTVVFMEYYHLFTVYMIELYHTLKKYV